MDLDWDLDQVVTDATWWKEAQVAHGYWLGHGQGRHTVIPSSMIGARSRTKGTFPRRSSTVTPPVLVDESVTLFIMPNRAQPRESSVLVHGIVLPPPCNRALHRAECVLLHGLLC